MDKYEGYFKMTADVKVTKVADFPCINNLSALVSALEDILNYHSENPFLDNDEYYVVLEAERFFRDSCVLLNNPDSLTDSSKTAESLSENVSV